MKTLAFHTVVPARLFLFAAAVTGPATTLLAEASRVDVETLHQMKVEDVPEEVILKGLTYMEKNESAIPCRAFILEKIPHTWSVPGTSRLSVSDRYSQAGVKSIRWDWKAGDVLRITGLKTLGDSKAPYRLSVFQERALPDNSVLNVFYSKKRHRGRSRFLARERYFMHYDNWYSLGLSEVTGAPEKLKRITVDSMPDGMRKPALGELLIQAPKNVASGTFFLDRLFVNLIDRNVNALRPDSIGEGKPDTPFDAFKYKPNPHGFASYYAIYTNIPEPPKRLTASQRAFVDKARPATHPRVLVPKTDRRRIRAEAEASAILKTFVKQDDGSYRYPEHINLAHYASFSHPVFPGDVILGWKEKIVTWKKMRSTYSQWYLQYPDSEPICALFKAFLTWSEYQGLEKDKQSGSQMHSAYGGTKGFSRDVIITLSEQDRQHGTNCADYASAMTRWYNGSYQIYLRSKEPGADGEPGIAAATVYQSMFLEPNDEKLYRDLSLLRDTWEMMFAISDTSARPIIKPDFSFFHHGHLIGYWGGNYPGYINLAQKFIGTELDFSPLVKRSLALNSISFIYCVATIHDINPWLENDFGDYRPGTGVRPDSHSTERILPHLISSRQKFDTVFDTFYSMDWDEVPAAEKLVSAVLRDYHAEPEVLRKIEQNYPKTKNITLAEQSHISINWSAASVYTTGFSKVHAKGFNSMGGSVPEPEPCYNLWPRALGSLFVHESALDSSQRDATRGHYLFRAHLGGSADGYDWTRTSGVTVPKLTLEESKAVGVAGLGSTRIDAEDGTSQHYSGSVTFGETDRLLGQFGNLAILITPATTKRLLGRFVGDFQGEKTYHFIDDQVICLGSKYKAGAGREMETTLFQNAVNPEAWQHKDVRRWNPGSASLVVNGERFDRPIRGRKSWSLGGNIYVVSPYGHAWLIPEKQRGSLNVSWKNQTSHYSDGRSDGVQEKRSGDFVTAWWNHGPADKASNHHYCLLLNSTGKDPSGFEAYVKENQAAPGYKVLRHDGVAHAIHSPKHDLYSYVIFRANQPVGLPHIHGSNRRLNVMLQPMETKKIKLAICDATVSMGRNDDRKKSPPRTVKIKLAHENCRLLEAKSGLPATNPPLDAKITGEKLDNLTYRTSNATTDQFVVAFQ